MASHARGKRSLLSHCNRFASQQRRVGQVGAWLASGALHRNRRFFAGVPPAACCLQAQRVVAQQSQSQALATVAPCLNAGFRRTFGASREVRSRGGSRVTRPGSYDPPKARRAAGGPALDMRRRVGRRGACRRRQAARGRCDHRLIASSTPTAGQRSRLDDAFHKAAKRSNALQGHRWLLGGADGAHGKQPLYCKGHAARSLCGIVVAHHHLAAMVPTESCVPCWRCRTRSDIRRVCLIWGYLVLQTTTRVPNLVDIP